MAKEGVQKGDLEEVLIASRATDEDLEAGLLGSSGYGVDSQGNPMQAPQQRSSVKRNVSELGQRVRRSFHGQSDMPTPPPAPVPANPLTSSHPPLPKSAMKKAGFQLVNTSSPGGSVTAGSATVGSPLDSLPAVPRSDHARSLFPGVGQSWEDRQQQAGKGEGLELGTPTRGAKFAEPSDTSQNTGFRIAAGGDKQSRQSRLATDFADSFKQEDDALAKEDFSGFDKPTRIEGEGGHVDPDPGDRDSVS